MLVLDPFTPPCPRGYFVVGDGEEYSRASADYRMGIAHPAFRDAFRDGRAAGPVPAPAATTSPRAPQFWYTIEHDRTASLALLGAADLGLRLAAEELSVDTPRLRFLDGPFGLRPRRPAVSAPIEILGAVLEDGRGVSIGIYLYQSPRSAFLTAAHEVRHVAGGSERAADEYERAFARRHAAILWSLSE